jgi:hypothetical protein
MTKAQFKAIAKAKGILTCRYAGNYNTMYVISPDIAIGQTFMGFIRQYEDDIPFKIVYQLN